MDANVSIGGLFGPFGVNLTDVSGTAVKDEVDIFEKFTEEQRAELMVYRVFAYTIGSLIIVSNLVVVVSSGLILKKGSQCKSTFLLLGNVSLADTLIGANVIFGISFGRDAVSEAMCVVQIGLIVSPTLVSIFTVGLIAVDRYIYILHGLYYRRWINTTRVRLCILFTWLLGLTLGFMPATGWAGDSMGGRKCWYITIAPRGLITIISIIGLLPIFVVCILYSIILFHALQKVTQLRSTNAQATRIQDSSDLRVNRGKLENTQVKIKRTNDIGASDLSIHTISASVESGLENRSNSDAGNKLQKMINKLRQSANTDKKRKENEEPNKWRAIKVVMLTTGSFVCTWVPYFIATILYILCDKETDEERCTNIEIALASPLAILGLLNSLLNPLIYAWWHRGFKMAARKMLCGFRDRCTSSTEPLKNSSHSNTT